MKTNHLMQLVFSTELVEIGHLTLYGNMTQLVKATDRYRIDEGKRPLSAPNVIKSAGFNEHARLLEADDTFDLDARGAWYRIGEGSQTQTYAHIMLLLYVAQVASSTFHYEFNKRTVMDRLFEYRDIGGDNFILLNRAIDLLPDRQDRNNTGVYIQVAKLLRHKITGQAEWDTPGKGVVWNHQDAERNRQRSEHEAYLTRILQGGLVRDYDHLKQIINDL